MGLLSALRHKSVAGDENGAYWTYSSSTNPLGPCIYMRLTFGRRVSVVDVPVCSQKNPRSQCWILMHHRGSREVWLLSDLMVSHDLNRVASSTPFAKGMVAGSVELMNCPPDLATELEAL